MKKSVDEQQFINGVSLPRDMRSKNEVLISLFNLKPWFFSAVRKNDILTKVFLERSFDADVYRKNYSPVDEYIRFIFKSYDLFGETFKQRFEDYYQTAPNGNISISVEKIYRKFSRGDFVRVLKPFDWVFDFMERVSSRFDFPFTSVAQCIRHSLYNRGSHIDLVCSADDMIVISKYLVDYTAMILQQLLIPGFNPRWLFKSMLLELFTTSVDKEKSKEIIQCLRPE